MPVGSFYARERMGRSQGKLQEKKKPGRKKTGSAQTGAAEQDRSGIHILLIGRRLSIVEEFLCSMNQNMGEALGEEGMSFYTKELDTISGIVDRKKQLERFFWNCSQEDWTYPLEEQTEKDYTFSIGIPDGRVLDLIFHCVTPQGESGAGGEQAHAVWLLTDGLLLKQGAGEDSYLQWLQELLAQEKGRPVCLVLAQVEGMGHVQTGTSLLPAEVSRRLTAVCERCFADSAADGKECPVLPVQVYGGLECMNRDTKGDPVLRRSSDGFYQSYVPENCHIPGLYTLQVLFGGSESEAFAQVPKEVMDSVLRGIRHHYSVRFGDSAWKPVVLKGGEGHER